MSLPHGWGHTGDHLRMKQALKAPGANFNVLTDDQEVEPITGTPYFTGVPVTLTKIQA